MHYREIHKATVTRNDDPAELGRIRVKCQSIAAAGTELPFWVEPVFPFTSNEQAGWFAVPTVGSEVELEVLVGADSDAIVGESFLIEPDPHYRAGAYSENNPIPSEFTVNYPQRSGMKTPGGHLIVLDDTAGAELALFQSTLGSALALNPDKGVKLSAASGNAFWELVDSGSAIANAAHVFLGGSLAIEQLIHGTSFRAAQNTCDNVLNAQMTIIATQLGIIATQLGIAAAALTGTAGSLTTAGADPLLIASAPVAAAALTAGGAALTPGGPALGVAGGAAGAAGGAATAAAAAITVFDPAPTAHLSNVSKTL